MALTQSTVVTNNISTLNPLPNDVGGLTATQFQYLFDKFGAEFTTYFNNIHLAQLASITAGTSGADGIGATAPAGLVGATSQALFNDLVSKVLLMANTTVYVPATQYNPATKGYVDSVISGVVLGQVPDGSLLDVKLSNAAGQIKDTVTTHLADYVRQPAYINPTAGTSTAYTGSTTPALSAYSEGVGVTIIPHVDSGASPTFAWGALGAIPLFEQDGTTPKVMLAGKPYSFKKVGTSFLADSSGEIKIAGQVEITATFAGAISKNDPVYITGVYSQDTSTKLADPAILPAGYGYRVAFSTDGTYMAVAHATTPYITIYKRSGDVFTKLANPATLPTGTGRGVAFSYDGTYMAVAHDITPYITIYKRSGDVFTKLANPAILPTGIGNGVAFSSDGVYMAVAIGTTPYIMIYKRAGDVFTKLADPAILPVGAGAGVAFSYDGTYMAVVHSATPFVTIYKGAGDVFTKLANPTVLPAGAGLGVAFSTDGVYMTVTYDTTPFATIYKRAGDVFTKLANPAILPAGAGRGVAFSTDGVYMTVAHDLTPFVTIYKRAGDVFTKLADPAILPVGAGAGVAFSYDGTYMAVVHSATPFVTIYKGGTYLGLFVNKSNNLLTELTNSLGAGYAKESGVLNEVKKVIQLWG